MTKFYKLMVLNVVGNCQNRRTIPFIIFLCSLAFSKSYAQKPEWIRNSEVSSGSWGGTDGRRIALHPDGSIFVIGQYGGSNLVGGHPLNSRPNTVSDGFLAKYNADGDVIWVKQLFESTGHYGNRVIDLKVDHAGDLVFSGACFSSTSVLGSIPGIGAFIAKIDANANRLWVNFESGVSLQDSDVSRRGNRIGFDQHHHILWYTDQITGVGTYTGGLAVIKYKPDGTKIKNMFVTRNPGFYHPNLNDFAVDSEGNFIVSGNFSHSVAFTGGPSITNNGSNTNPHQFFLAKFSADGTFLWTARGNSGGSVITAHMVDNQNNIYFAVQLRGGTKMYTVSGIHDSNGERLIVKLTPEGQLTWANQLNDASVYDLFQAQNGLIYATGMSYATFRYQSYIRAKQTPGTSAYILKVNTDGTFYGALHGYANDDPNTPFGAETYGYQSLVDGESNIYTIGDFREGQSWGCIPATTQEESFYLIKHIAVDSPVRTISGPPGQLCSGTEITLTTTLVSNAVLYKWYIPGGSDPGSGTVLQNSINLITAVEHNNQPVIVSIVDNCDEYFAEPFVLDIVAAVSPIALIDGKELVCPGSAEQFVIGGNSDGNTLNWNLPAGITSLNVTTSGATLVFAQDFISGTVKVSVSGPCGGSFQLEFDINTYKTPIAPSLEGEILLCTGLNTIQSSIAEVPDAMSYQWELPPFIAFDPLYSEGGSTLYASVFPQFESGEIRVRAVGHCDVSEASSPITVRRVGSPSRAQSISGPLEICSSNHETVRYAIPSIPNADRYNWNVPTLFDKKGKLVTTTPYIDVQAKSGGSGYISVYGTNSCQEKGDSSSLEIISYESLQKPVLSLSKCHNEITISGDGVFEWYINGMFLPNLQENHVFLEDSGTYHVEVRNFCGVQRSEGIAAYPVLPSKLLMPNVITPNGDGSNDFFQIDKSLANSSLEIMNRWGSRVYFSTVYENNFSADDLSSGTYFYLLRNSCLAQPYKGAIQVIK